MIPIASGVRVWIATGHTDMRRGMNSLALLVQEAFTRDPHGGDLYVFRVKLIKILWHDGLGMSLYAKRLERGRFLWPSSADGVVTISPAQLTGDRRRLADRWDLNRWHDQRLGQRPRLVILWSTMSADDSLPDDVTTLQAMLRAERAARLAAEAEAQAGILLIEKLKLTIKKLRHDQFGQSSERSALLDQLELQLADLEENAAQVDTAGADGSREDCGAIVRAPQASTPAAAGAFAAGARYLSSACHLPVLRRQPIAQDCGGRDRDAGAHSAPVEGDPARAREARLPGLRSDHPAARSLAPDCARACRAQAAGPCPVRQGRPALAASSSERRLPA